MTTDDDLNGKFEGSCQGCDAWQPLNDLGLCDECAQKLDRDLIRERDWDYSALAFGCPPEKREQLRAEIISRYGPAYELIAPGPPPEARRRRDP